MFLIFSTFPIIISGWGDVLHYPEFVKSINEIGSDKDDLHICPEEQPWQENVDHLLDRKRNIHSAFLFRVKRGERRKRSFSTFVIGFKRYQEKCQAI